MTAILAGASLWESSELPVMLGPREIGVEFGVTDSRSLDATLVADSSDESLPDPSTDGDNTIEEVLAKLNYTDNFTSDNLTLEQISQLLWAGYGVTNHTASNGNEGLTVPSAYADYYLTECIYMLNENGAYRYHNRNPSDDLTTRDHKIEQTVDYDVRADLQSDVSDLPDAPCYVILCLDYDYINEMADAGHGGSDNATVERYALLETGFVASNMLMQASALGLGAHFEAELTTGEAVNVKSTANVSTSQTPMVIVSIGTPAQTRTLASYSDSGHDIACDDFDNYSTEHTAYMYATNLLSNHNYRVAYYDGSDTKVYTDDQTSGASGNLSSQRTFDKETDTAGLWNVIVCETYLTPSDSYNSSWAYTIISDNFTATESAIPEFPTVTAAIVAISLCGGVYFWIRHKAVTVPT